MPVKVIAGCIATGRAPDRRRRLEHPEAVAAAGVHDVLAGAEGTAGGELGDDVLEHVVGHGQQQHVAGARDRGRLRRRRTPGSRSGRDGSEASDSPATETISWPRERRAAARTAPRRPGRQGSRRPGGADSARPGHPTALAPADRAGQWLALDADEGNSVLLANVATYAAAVPPSARQQRAALSRGQCQCAFRIAVDVDPGSRDRQRETEGQADRQVAEDGRRGAIGQSAGERAGGGQRHDDEHDHQPDGQAQASEDRHAPNRDAAPGSRPTPARPASPRRPRSVHSASHRSRTAAAWLRTRPAEGTAAATPSSRSGIERTPMVERSSSMPTPNTREAEMPPTIAGVSRRRPGGCSWLAAARREAGYGHLHWILLATLARMSKNNIRGILPVRTPP